MPFSYQAYGTFVFGFSRVFRGDKYTAGVLPFLYHHAVSPSSFYRFSITLLPFLYRQRAKEKRHDAASLGLLCSLFTHRSVITCSGTVFGILVGHERLAAGCACARELLVSFNNTWVCLPPCILTFRGAEPLRDTCPLWQQLSALLTPTVISSVVAGHEHLHAAKGHSHLICDFLVSDSFRPHFQNGRFLRSCHHSKTPPLVM